MQAKSGKNNGPFHWLEKRLWRSGVQDPMIREILCWQISVKTPPHAWGRLPLSPALSRESKNTPTCVGKTLNDH